ncbi:hypothetical protein J6590_063297 [Homalodisca vitripennis]|nr:hypothetical protein J6590_063297 [Homalodisca vitripennis]
MMAKGFFRLGYKLSILGGSWYYTARAGLWGEATQTEQLYNQVCQLASLDTRDVHVQSRGPDMLQTVMKGWNYGVLVSTDLLIHLPPRLGEWVYSRYEQPQGSSTFEPYIIG